MKGWMPKAIVLCSMSTVADTSHLISVPATVQLSCLISIIRSRWGSGSWDVVIRVIFYETISLYVETSELRRQGVLTHTLYSANPSHPSYLTDRIGRHVRGTADMRLQFGDDFLGLLLNPQGHFLFLLIFPPEREIT